MCHSGGVVAPAGDSASLDLISTFSQGKMDAEMFALYLPASKIYKNLWEKVIDDAEAFNDPGRFTALIGFERTSLIQGNNMHRVVIMRDGEAHPFLSPDDEFADYETWDIGNFDSGCLPRS